MIYEYLLVGLKLVGVDKVDGHGLHGSDNNGTILNRFLYKKNTHKTCVICWIENFDEFPVVLALVVYDDANGGVLDDESGQLKVLRLVFCVKDKL